jgi:hypothetical protein
MTDTVFAAAVTVFNPGTGAEETFYASTAASRFTVSGSPATNTFTAGLLQPAIMERTAFDSRTTRGRGRMAVGQMVLHNGHGVLDKYRTYGFAGRTVTIALGQFGDDYPGDFVTVLDGTMAAATFGQETVTIRLRDWQRAAYVPLQTAVYAGDNVLPDGLEGTSDLKGKPKPFCIGDCSGRSRVPAICVNPSKLIHQVNDGAVDSIAVYDRGVSLGSGFPFTLRTTGFGAGSNGVFASTYGGGLYVIAGDGGHLETSPDGTTWTSRTSTFGTSSIRGLAYGGGVYVAVGADGKIASSTNGTAWTSRTSASFGTGSIVGATYGNGLFVICGYDGANGHLETSPDGVTWTARTSGFGASTILAAEYSSDLKLFAIGGASGKLATSSNGTAWTLRTSGFGTNSINGFGAGNRLLVAVGANATLATSSDGVEWSLRTSGFPATYQIRDVAYGGGLFVAVGDTGANNPVMTSSTNGIDWTVRQHGFGASAALWSITYGDHLFVATDIWNYTVGTSAVPADYANAVDLEDDTLAPAAGTYKTYLAGGYFRLGSTPAGTVTADVVQGATAADRTAGQLIVDVLGRAGFVGGDWSASDITALDAANSSVLGYYTADAGVKCADVIDLLAQSVGAWWSTDAAGVIRVKRLEDPADNIVQHSSALATSPWGATGTAVVTNAVASYAGKSFSRITGASGGGVFQTVNLTSSQTYTLQAYFKSNGVAGTTGFLLIDTTSSTVLAQAIVTIASTGTITAAAVGGGTLSRIALLPTGEGVYGVTLTTTGTVNGAHTNVVYAHDAGSATSLLMSEVSLWEGTPAATLDQATDMDGMEQVPSADNDGGIPQSRTVVRYSRNYAPLNSTDLAGAVTDADRVLFGSEWLDAGTDEDAAVITANPLASYRTDETLLTSESDAQDEADRRQAFYGVQRYWFDVPLYVSATTAALELGDVVELVTDRYLMNAGQRALVLGVRPDWQRGRVLVSVLQ